MLAAIRIFCLSALVAFVAQSAPAPDAAAIRAQLDLAAKESDAPARIELLRRLLDIEPADADARRTLVALWLEVADYDMAEAAIGEWPAAPAPLAARVHAYALFYRDRKTGDAIDLLRSSLRSDPKDRATLEQLSDFLGQMKRWEEQRQVLDTLIALCPRSAEFLLARANARRATGDYRGAVQDAKAAQSLSPDLNAVKNNLPAYERLDKAIPSIESAGGVLRESPKDLRALLTRGALYQSSDIQELALADALAALEIDPGSASAKITAARGLRQLDRGEEIAVRRLSEVNSTGAPAADSGIRPLIDADIALAANARDVAALKRRAALLNGGLSQYRLALADADAALALDPKDAAAVLLAIRSRVSLGQRQEAVALEDRLDGMGPPPRVLAEALGLLAQAYYDSYEPVQAIDFADRSLKLAETVPVLRIKAACLQRAGRQEEADAVQARIKQLKSAPSR